MNTATATPKLEELYGFIGKIRKYPIPVGRVIELARRSGTSREVIDFYKSFHPGIVFLNKDELVSRSEQVDIMREESADMPQEEERSTEEY